MTRATGEDNAMRGSEEVRDGIYQIPERGQHRDRDNVSFDNIGQDRPGPDDRPDPERADAITGDADRTDRTPGADPDSAVGVAEVPDNTKLPDNTAPDNTAPDNKDSALDTEPEAHTSTDPMAPSPMDTPPADQAIPDPAIPGQAGPPDQAADTTAPATEAATEQPTAAEQPTATEQPSAAEPEHAADGPVLGDRSSEYHDRWREVQASFVDDPAAAVRSADDLFADVVAALSTALTERQQALGEWRDAPEQGTEELRTTLMRYRVVFQRLISV